ncbi:DNA-processing protein DprA [Nocardia thailandica]|uniref:DNA-processing protein DprA n=1 Tax=Nocardia thailandica TaxID=257275 RepID=A0ABW6PS79_9NOCA
MPMPGKAAAPRHGAPPGNAVAAAERPGPDPAGHGGTPPCGEERRAAWVYLSRVVQGPCAPLSALIDAVGVVEAARAVRERELPEPLRAATRSRREIDSAAADLALLERLGGRVITPDDAEWPAWRMLGLGQLDAARERDAAVPLVLWVRGPRSLLELTERAVGVVGARCATGYGVQVAGEIGADLAARGWTVVSGAAFGIDAAAHRAALAVGGATVAVLACGLDRPYPAQHERLLDTIADTGLVVSEYPPGSAALKHRFLARNRLIATLSDGVLVAEAGLRSGARNTVKWARRLGRPALAVPGPVTSAASVGCHRMIRDGEVLLVTRADEVADELGPLRLPADAAPDADPADTLTGAHAAVYTALPVMGSRRPRDLAAQTCLDLATVRAVLPALELSGLVGVDDSGWFRIRRPGR